MASSRRVRIIIEVDTDLPLKTLEAISYAETRRPCPLWLSDDLSDATNDNGILIESVKAEEVQ